MILRALKAVKLLTRIREERPDLWLEIVAFAEGKDGMARIMDEVEKDYRELFERNIRRQ